MEEGNKVELWGWQLAAFVELVVIMIGKYSIACPRLLISLDARIAFRFVSCAHAAAVPLIRAVTHLSRV